MDPVGDAGASQPPGPAVAEGLLVGWSGLPLLNRPESGAELGGGGGRGLPQDGSLGIQGGVGEWASGLGAACLLRMLSTASNARSSVASWPRLGARRTAFSSSRI